MTRTQFDTQVCATAQDNMDYDVHLLNTLSSDTRLIRLYTWGDPGITYSYKQTVPDDLAHLDHGKRVTGGGIVFHSPGDIVLTCCAWLRDPAFPTSLKSKLSFVSECIQVAARECGLSFDTHAEKPLENMDFCQTYPNPYELYFDGKKVVAFTLRRYKDRFIIHIEIHVSPTHPMFTSLSKYSAVFSERLPIEADGFKQALHHVFQLA